MLAAFGLQTAAGYRFVLAVSLGGMRADPLFKDLSDAAIQQIANIPSLLCVPGSLLVGWLVTKISKKKLGLISIAVLFITGMLPMWLNSYPAILADRCIGGFFLGIAIPVGTSIVADHFFGADRAKVYGWAQAVAVVFTGVFLNIIAGYLAAIHWRKLFWIYLYMIICFLFVLFGVKDKGKEPPKEGTSGLGTMFKLPGKTWFYLLIFCIYMILFHVYSLNMAMHIAGRQIGTPVTAGYCSSFLTAGAGLAGLVFGFIAKGTKHFTKPVGIIITACGCLLMAFAQNPAMCFAAAFIGGFGSQFVIPACNTSVSASVDPVSVAAAMAWANIAYQGGQFIAPYILNFFGKFCGADTGGRFMFSAITCVVLGVLLAIRAVSWKSKGIEGTSPVD